MAHSHDPDRALRYGLAAKRGLRPTVVPASLVCLQLWESCTRRHGNLFLTAHARMGVSLLQRGMVFGNPVLDLVIKLGGLDHKSIVFRFRRHASK